MEELKTRIEGWLRGKGFQFYEGSDMWQNSAFVVYMKGLEDYMRVFAIATSGQRKLRRVFTIPQGMGISEVGTVMTELLCQTYADQAVADMRDRIEQWGRD